MMSDIKKSFERVNLEQSDCDKLYINIYKKANKEKGYRTHMEKHFAKRSIVTAACICMLIGMTGVAVAAVKWLTPSQVATKFEDEKLAKVFGTNEADYVVQDTKKYRIVYMGTVTGTNISDQILLDDLNKNRTYSIFAIEKKDGTPFKSEDTDSERFWFAPLFEGEKPDDSMLCAMSDLNISAKGMVIDGIKYRIVEVNDLDIFADRKVYLSVFDSNFNIEPSEMYQLDESTGKISRNLNYEGVNCLFEIPLDSQKANTQKADEWLMKWNEWGTKPAQPELWEENN